MKILLQYVGIAVLSSICTFFLCRHFYQLDNATQIAANLPVKLVNSEKNAPINANPRGWSNAVLPDFTSVAKQVTGAVVSISAFNATGYRMSSGSGVVISSDGYVITIIMLWRMVRNLKSYCKISELWLRVSLGLMKPPIWLCSGSIIMA
ncbi:MAG: hypothetical protein IPJ74_07950 [Saprospiraceae bacterium]|nr:hypothetical protein [Saprospiraceae bacterium]